MSHRLTHKEIEELAATYGTPLYVYDEEQIKKNIRMLRTAFKKNYPNTYLYYALKANSNRALVHLVTQCGMGLECSSPGELYLAKKARATNVAYTSHYAQESEIENILHNNVDVVTIDSINVLEKLKKRKKKITLLFRLNVEDVMSGAGFAMIGESSKFGMPHDAILPAVQCARSLGFERIGIHMMGGSNVCKPALFEDVVHRVMQVAKKIKDELAIDISAIDIGGGLGIPYVDGDKPLDVEGVAKRIGETINRLCKKYAVKKPDLIIEPGRYVMGNAGTLLGRVTSMKESYKKFVGTDMSVNSVLRIPLFKTEQRISVHPQKRTNTKECVTVCGQLCWADDVLARDVTLTAVQPGDIIQLHDVGAYGFCHSNNFNTRERPAEVLVSGKEHFLIRKRETVRDFDRLVHVPQHLR